MAVGFFFIPFIKESHVFPPALYILLKDIISSDTGIDSIFRIADSYFSISFGVALDPFLCKRKASFIDAPCAKPILILTVVSSKKSVNSLYPKFRSKNPSSSCEGSGKPNCSHEPSTEIDSVSTFFFNEP